jgi:hypothetical protein
MNEADFLNSIKPGEYLLHTEYDFQKRLESFDRIAQTVCPGFELDNDNREIYMNTIKYFAGDKTSIYDLRKGLYVYGKVGVGKTMYFKIFNTLNRAVKSPVENNFSVINVNDLVTGFALKGFEYLSNLGFYLTYCGGSYGSGSGYGPGHMLLDDLGQSASTVKHFGNNTNVIAEFIQRRYYIYIEAFKLTHVSTNMSPDQIKKEYGEFVASRMRQMFNRILFPGNDKRK